MSFDSEDKHRIFQETQKTDSDALSFVIVTESSKKIALTLRNLSFNTLMSDSNQQNFTIDKKLVKFESLILKSAGSFLDNVCLFSTSNHLALFYDQELFVINTQTGSILLEKNFSVPEIKADYFLSPTNLNMNGLFNLTPIQHTTFFLALSNLDQLVAVELINLNTTPDIKKFTSHSSIKFSSFEINKNVLVAFSKNTNKFIFYDLDRVLKFRSFTDKKVIMTEKQFASDSIIPEHLYGMSRENKYFYTIENNKMLKFFKVITHNKCIELKLVADIYLYCKPRGIICNEEFIGLSMSDFKVIAYLIGDPNNIDETMARIKKLPSR